MARRIDIHMLPVATIAGNRGWLVSSKRKRSRAVRFFVRLEDVGTAWWDEGAKCWFVAEVAAHEAMDAIQEACAAETVATTYCAACSAGRPCSVWRGGIVRHGYSVQVEPEAKPPPAAPAQPPPPPPSWWSAIGQQPAPSPPPPQPPPPPASSQQVPGQGARVAAQVARDVFGAFVFARDGIPKPVQDYVVRQAVGASFMVGEALLEWWRGFVRQRTGAPGSPGGEMTAIEAARVLGLRWPCTSEEVVAAYRRAAFQSHPDRGGSEVTMARINAARSVLAKRLGS